MKLVALRKFHNAKHLGVDINEKTPNFEHLNEVPKGHRFELGGDFKTITAMSKAQDPQTDNVKALVGSRAAIIDDGTPEVDDIIKQTLTEVKAESGARKALTPTVTKT